MDRDQLEVLTEARVLADIDRFFALSMADLGAGPEVVLSAAAVSAMHRAGHTCLPLAEAGKPLAEIVERPSSEDGEEVPEHALAIRLPARAAWRAALAASPVVAVGAADPPPPLGLARPPTTSVGLGLRWAWMRPPTDSVGLGSRPPTDSVGLCDRPPRPLGFATAHHVRWCWTATGCICTACSKPNPDLPRACLPWPRT